MYSLYVLGLLSGLFWIFLRQGLAFLVKTGCQSWSRVILIMAAESC